MNVGRTNLDNSKLLKQTHFSPSFGSLFRLSSYVDCNGQYRHTQNTTGRREDLNYDECARLIKKRFSKFDKINIMPMNGSDGTEAYLLAHSLLKEFGEKKAKQKIFPITVTDVDSFIIYSFGKKGIVAFRPEDIDAFGKDFDKYFKEIPRSELPNIPNAYSLNTRAFKLTPFFKNLFEFKVQDFQKRITHITDEGNSVVIIRNCLAQAFGYVQSMLMVAELDKKIKNSSLFIIGQYDRDMMKRFVPGLKTFFDFHEVGKNIFSKQSNLSNYANSWLAKLTKIFKQ
ncbi:hypothetical protein IKU74_01810 [bacterium]|nr:hypothetical protein [bacterium]